MTNTHVKIHSTNLAPKDYDLPAGVMPYQLHELGRRADEWVAWRAGRIPEPKWHYPATRRLYDAGVKRFTEATT